MRVFVAYGFNERDSWIPKFVFPIIKAFNDEAVDGANLQGAGAINDVIRKDIEESDLLIGFTTRREKIDGKDEWNTHTWVIQEMEHAYSKTIPVVEIRETSICSVGINSTIQQITYDDNHRDECLVKIVEAIGGKHAVLNLNLSLEPETFHNEIKDSISNSNYKCCYQFFKNDYKRLKTIDTDIIPMDEILYVRAKDIPRDSYIKVSIEFGGKKLESEFHSSEKIPIFPINLRPINFKKENV
ncbi:MAG: hypothetical protein HQK92_06380 [Nitrospirae bacterium]|nr:hypothetical protein [Nitrospirota bacterium]